MNQIIPWRTRTALSGFCKLLRQNLLSVLIWFLVPSVLAGLLWIWVIATIAEDKAEIESKARRSAVTQAKAYAEQLDRSLSQIDYIMLNLKYHWQDSGGTVNLEKQKRAGLVPVSSELLLTLVDRNGKPVTSTMAFDKNMPGIADRSYFQAHRRDASYGLLISEPILGLRTKRMKIMLSRRLDTPNGNFDGLIVIATDPSYFVSFPIDSTIHQQDFVAVRKADGTFFAAKTAADTGARDALYKVHPGFPNSADVVRESGEKFVDGIERIVAWDTAKNYPIVSLVGLSLDTRYAAYHERERELRSFATLGSIVLFLLGSSGIGYSLWRTRKKGSFNEVIAAYRLATENAQDAFYMMRPIHGPDGQVSDFVIEDCNERGATNFGTVKEALIGRTLSGHVPEQYLDKILQSCPGCDDQGHHGGKDA
jgi:hypothetical protein